MTPPHDGILLCGGGGHCRSVIDVLEQCALPIAGIVHGAQCAQHSVFGYAALGTDADLPVLRRQFCKALVTVGQIKTPFIRKNVYELLMQTGFTLVRAVSPLAYVSPHASIGAGTVVMHGAIVNAGARIGENCIINSRALVEHGCVVSPHCHISVGATLCGDVLVAEGSFVGAGSILREGITVPENSVIGCGVTIRKNFEAGQ